MSSKYVYFFGNGQAEGDAGMKELLGGKGAGLAEMTNIGIPVPAGFTISTEVCTHFMNHDGGFPDGLEAQVRESVARVENVRIIPGRLEERVTYYVSVRAELEPVGLPFRLGDLLFLVSSQKTETDWLVQKFRIGFFVVPKQDKES